MSKQFGIFWPFQAPGWLGAPPDGWGEGDRPSLTGEPIPDSWRAELFTETLRHGIRITPERWGLIKFDFSEWQPSTRAGSRDGGELGFEQTVKVFSHRLRVINVFLLLAESASLQLESFHLEQGA